MAERIQYRSDRAKGAVALLLAAAFLSPLFGKAPTTRNARPTPSPVTSAADPHPAPPLDVLHPCQYVIASWVRTQDKSDDQSAQERLSDAINHLLPDPSIVRAKTQKLWQALRDLAGKPEKQDPLDHYDRVSVTETLDDSTGRMTVEISVRSVPEIRNHDFRLGPDTAVRIDGCTLPKRNVRGEHSCQDQEIEDIAEKIKAHDDKHEQGKYAMH
jgi:hypothetical protein